MSEKNEYLKYIKQSFELKNQKFYKEAIEVLYKILDENPDNETLVEVISQIGDLHILLKNNERAIEQYERALEIDKNHIHTKKKLLEIYFDMKDYKKALMFASEMCKSSNDPNDFESLFKILLKLDKKDEIIKIYEPLNDELKNCPKLLYIISKIKENRQEILENLIEIEPKHIKAKFDLVKIYFEQKKYEKAEKFIDEVLKLKSKDVYFYYKALLQAKRGDFFPSIENFHQAIKLNNGKKQEYYFELAKAYMEINWFEEAINTIKKSITLCTEQCEDIFETDKRYLLLGWIFEKQTDYDNALFNLSLISEDSKLKTEKEILVSLIEYKKGNIVSSKEHLEKIYRDNKEESKNLTLLSTLANIYKDLKLNKKAVEFYEKYLEICPESFHVVSEYIDLLIDLKDYERAEFYINKYSKYKIANLLNSSARIHYRKHELEDALICLDKLIKDDKNNAETYYFKGLILNDKEDYNNALVNVLTALELNPAPAKYYAQTARSYLGLKNYNDAMAFIKEAVEIDPCDLNYKNLAHEIAQKAGFMDETLFWNSIVKRTEGYIKENKRF